MTTSFMGVVVILLAIEMIVLCYLIFKALV